MSVDDTIRTSLEQLVRPVDDPDAIVTQVNQRQARQRRRRNIGRALTAAALVVVLGVTAAAIRLPGSDDEVTAGVPGGDLSTSLPVPPAGEVVAHQLVDGTPVWVVRNGDETVSVLDALSPHQPFGIGHLVGWCATSRSFEDPQWGSVFNERGEKRGGPAPSGLGAYEVGPVTDGKVLVSPPSSPRGYDGSLTPPAALQGPPCHGDERHYNPGTLLLHDVGGMRSVTLADAMDAPEGDLVLVRDSTILLTPEGATVCPSVVESRPTPPTCDGVAAPELALGEGRTWATLTGTFLARLGEDALFDVVFVSGLVLGPDEVSTGLGDLDTQAVERCRPHLDDYGVEAKLLVARTVSSDYEAECWIDGQVAKSPPEGEPFDLAVIGVRTDGTAELIRAGYVDSTVLPSGGPADDAHADGPAFEVLAMTPATEPMGTLRSAVNQEQLVELWGASGAEGPAPFVDLEQWVVVSMTIPDDACPPELTRFESAGMVLTPVFTEPPGGCRLPLIPKTFIVALERATLTPSFVLRLPGNEVYGYNEQQLRVEVESP